jgi:colanic acid biosynthesis glycosyl transferase WcaI
VSRLKRILHEGTFVATSMLRALVLRRPDVFVVVSPPLLLGVAAWLVGKVKGAPFVFHVQDLQPDAAVGLGMLKPSAFTRALYGIEAFAYRKATRVSGITRGMLRTFQEKGVAAEKQVYFPNTIDLKTDGPEPDRGAFRKRHGFPEDEFLAVYSGNLGVKQGLEILLETAALLRDRGIRFLICGDGAQREMLAARATEMRLPNFSLLPLQPDRDYAALLRDADVCFVTQQAGAGNAFFPSKLLALLAKAKPVVTVASPESDLALALAEGNFGVNVQPGRPEELASVLDALAKDPARLAGYGAAGRRYVEQFEKTRVLENFLRELARVL